MEPDYLAKAYAKEAMRPILTQCCASIESFCNVFLPKRFTRRFSPYIHGPLFDALDNDALQKVLIVAPRGIGKSTILNCAFPLQRLIFQKSNFTVPISASYSLAVMFSEGMKAEIENNPIINKTFGNLKGDTWAQDSWGLRNTGWVMPRGADQQLRGLLHNGSRPDTLLIDDADNDEVCLNEERLAKLKHWFYNVVDNLVDKGLPNWRVIVLGSLIHHNSLVAELMEDPSWHKIILSICTPDFKTLWPEQWPQQRLDAEIETKRKIGRLASFYMEYMSMPVSAEDAPFRQSMFKYYEEIELRKKPNLETVVIMDPAKTVSATADDTAIIVVGVDPATQAIYVRDVVAGHIAPDVGIKTALDLCQRYGARALGVEVTSLHEFISGPIRNEISRRGLGIEFVELAARGGAVAKSKNNRIAALVPFYRQGLVFHNKGISQKLESQLLTYPTAKHDDVMDAFAYIVEMIELGERFMYPSAAEDEALAKLDFDDELEDLSGEPESAGLAWRIC